MDGHHQPDDQSPAALMAAMRAQFEQQMRMANEAHQRALAEQEAALMQHMQQQMQLMQQRQAPHAPPQQAAAPAAAAVAVALPPSPPGGPAAFPGPRLAPPSHYDGRASTLDEWCLQIKRQRDWYGLQSNDAAVIRLASAHLGATAYDWWESLAAKPTTWAEMQSKLRQRFQPITTAEMARNRLDGLTQGKAPIHDYVLSFRRLIVAVPDMNDAEKLHRFKKGLRPGIAAQLRIQGVNDI
jgi:hypothetical protein